MVQLWFQASVTCSPIPGAAFASVVVVWPPLAPVVTRLLTATVGPSGMETEGATEFAVWAVPIDIVTCEGTNSGSVMACARLKRIWVFANELSEEARSAVL